MSNVSIDNSGKVIIEDARIMYRNFAGLQTDFNADGARNFNVIIDDPDCAQMLQNEGWNVKFRQPRDPQEPGIHHIMVNVNYRSGRGPKIWLHTGNNVREITEDTVDQLDHADILGMDMVIAPYHWERSGSSGVSAYLDTMHVVIKEDPFAHKYANLEG